MLFCLGGVCCGRSSSGPAEFGPVTFTWWHSPGGVHVGVGVVLQIQRQAAVCLLYGWCACSVALTELSA